MTAGSREDGYRYIRETRAYSHGGYVSRYALYERQGGRARRVGTVGSYGEALAFLRIPLYALIPVPTRIHRG